jgi:hypothetical protein
MRIPGVRMFTLLVLGAVLPGALPGLSQETRDAACQRYATTPLPAEASVTTPPESPVCESYKSYSGIGREVDYKAARECAWLERSAQEAHLPQNPKAPVAWVVGGSVILTDLYANGLGVPRDVPLAARLACEQIGSFVSDAIPDLETRIADKQKADQHFEICDYAATTFEMNFCGAFSSELANDQRARSIAHLTAGWTPGQRTAFSTAKQAFDNYVKAVGEHETYLGGTIRNIRVQGEEQGLQQEFLLALQRYDRGQLPHGSPLEFQRADAELNLVYRKAVASAKKSDNSNVDGDVQPEGIQVTERAWLQYRDTWVTFAKLRYPSTDADVWRTSLTTARTESLKLTLCGFNAKDSVCTPTILKQLQDSL